MSLETEKLHLKIIAFVIHTTCRSFNIYSNTMHQAYDAVVVIVTTLMYYTCITIIFYVVVVIVTTV